MKEIRASDAIVKAKDYNRLRGALVANGTTLMKWAKSKGYPVTTVYDSAAGRRNGPVAKKIQKELEELIHA